MVMRARDLTCDLKQLTVSLMETGVLSIPSFLLAGVNLNNFNVLENKHLMKLLFSMLSENFSVLFTLGMQRVRQHFASGVTSK